MSYYVEALKRFDENTPCFVFSDDLDWCKSQDFLSQIGSYLMIILKDMIIRVWMVVEVCNILCYHMLIYA